MVDFVFPEDEGTGGHSSGSGDKNDAANFAAAFDAIGMTDFVATGMSFTLNASTPSLDISKGKAVVTDSSATATQTSETRDDGVAFVVEADSRSGLSLTDATTNHIFLDVDLTAEDAISIHIDTDDTQPSQPSLKIGTVDTSNDTTTELNRRPPVAVDAQDSGTTKVENADKLNFGSNLSVTDNGDTAKVDVSATGDHSVSDDGTEVHAAPTDVNFGNVFDVVDDGDDTVTVNGAGQTINIPQTELADGEFISQRIHVPSGKTIYFWTVGVQNASNSAPSGLTLEVDDETNAVSITGGRNSKYVSEDPLGSKSGAIDVAVRVENDTGGTENASGFAEYTIE